MDLAEKIYKVTKTFPKEERFGITAQMRDCAVSIPSNISEGAGRNSNAQFKHFLEIAMGSSNELQTQVELSRRLEYLTNEIAVEILDELIQIFKMILVFYNTL